MASSTFGAQRDDGEHFTLANIDELDPSIWRVWLCQREVELEWADDDTWVCAVSPLFVDAGMVNGFDTGSTHTRSVADRR